MDFKEGKIEGIDGHVYVVPSAEGGIFSRGSGLGAVIGNLAVIHGVGVMAYSNVLKTKKLDALAQYIDEDPERPGVYRFMHGAIASILGPDQDPWLAQVGNAPDEALVETLPPETAQFRQ
jgi:hypothetical protein